MLSDMDAIATIAVKDTAKASQFYEHKLGFKRRANMGDELITYTSGKTIFNIYRSGFAGTNKATALCWAVGSEFDRVLAALRSKGVAFEHYNLPGMKREGDVHTSDGIRVAWFKDPDGNVLNIIDR